MGHGFFTDGREQKRYDESSIKNAQRLGADKSSLLMVIHSLAKNMSTKYTDNERQKSDARCSGSGISLSCLRFWASSVASLQILSSANFTLCTSVAID